MSPTSILVWAAPEAAVSNTPKASKEEVRMGSPPGVLEYVTRFQKEMFPRALRFTISGRQVRPFERLRNDARCDRNPSGALRPRSPPRPIPDLVRQKRLSPQTIARWLRPGSRPSPYGAAPGRSQKGIHRSCAVRVQRSARSAQDTPWKELWLFVRTIDAQSSRIDSCG